MALVRIQTKDRKVYHAYAVYNRNNELLFTNIVKGVPDEDMTTISSEDIIIIDAVEII